MQAEPLPQEGQLKLLTALELQKILLQVFEDYRNSRKPGFLIDKPIEPALHSDEEDIEKAQEAPKPTPGMLGTIGSFFKSTAALAFEHGTRKHSTLTKFITEEMADILNQRGASPLKIMTDLTILLQGLEFYMSGTHSQALYPQVQSVGVLIWRYNSEDRDTFQKIFNDQIRNAQYLISHNTTLSDKNHTAGLRNPANPLIADNRSEWQYRCSEVGSNNVEKAPIAWMGEAYRAFLFNELPAVVAATAPSRNYGDVD